MQHCVLQQIWETKKVCKSSDAVLKSELDVVFHNGEVMILAIYNQKYLQVRCIYQCFSMFDCYLQISVGNWESTEKTSCEPLVLGFQELNLSQMTQCVITFLYLETVPSLVSEKIEFEGNFYADVETESGCRGPKLIPSWWGSVGPPGGSDVHSNV